MRWAIMVGILVLGTIATPALADTVTYSYDALGRLVTVAHSGSVNNAQQTVYTLDSTDNRTNVTTTGAAR